MNLSIAIHRFSLFLTLFVFWLIFSGYTETFFIVSGLLSCALSMYIGQRMDVTDREGHPMHVARHSFVFWFWLVWQVVLSSWEVTKVIWRPSLKISPTLGWTPAGQDSDLGKVIYANSITLTPGTVCVSVEGDQMLVHALNAESIKELDGGDMRVRVRHMTSAMEPKDS